VHHQVLDVAVGDAVVGVEDHVVAHGEFAIVGYLGAERLDHTSHLVAGEQSGIAHPMVRQGDREVALHGHVGGQTAATRYRAQAGETRRASWMITRTGAHHADAGTVRWHIRHGHVEAEDALAPGHAGTLDGELAAQLVHFFSAILNRILNAHRDEYR